ncbi:acyltransferase family protein [Pseudescherichia vulneris]|uniref:acyltransferase family protein n=1 Tax=Pseudescherichia vulneris TaxID=566 RepID=UPI0028B24D98|nr:acyltransferase [Pseudescherichia vulneris]
MHTKNSFDTMRLLAALLVLITHHFALSGMPEPSIPGFESLGGIAVIIFFSISGYLISKSSMRCSDFIEFMSKRIRRIIPALLPCAFFMYFIIGGWINNWNLNYLFSKETINNIISVITLSPPIDARVATDFKVPALNGSLWTLPLEFFCYLVAGFIISIWRDKRSFIIVFVIMLFASIYYLLSPLVASVFHIPLWLYPLRGMAFFFGSILAMYQDKWNTTNIKIFIASSLFLYMYASTGSSVEYQLIGYLFVSFATIAVCISFPDPFVKGRFDYSYGVYIYAFPVQQVVINMTHLNFYSGMAVSIAVTFLMASASWHLVEKQVLNHSKENKGIKV